MVPSSCILGDLTAAVFVDSLAIMLLALGSSASLLAMYFLYAVRQKKTINNLAIPIIGFGLFDFASGFLMSFTWPLPPAYNMLFGDPLLFLGLLMVMGGYMLYKNMNLKVLSIFGFFLGIYIFVEAVAILNFKLETGVDLLSSMGLYVFSGLSAILSPLVYLDPKSNNGKYAYYLLAVLLIIAAFAALFIGYAGIYGHLFSPP
ncbi:MAG: hypothetical protein BK997_03945 [Candidatus Micrarchaeum sp. ARMAN-1]|jgi:putative membrane protein|nr:MAG: hypothetical protein BK997_03945 [Candidatus Micrarchaeum sp. ARMAN-1]